MNRWTFERAIHKWDKWHDSIDRCRATLGFDPKWSREACINWIEEHYLDIRSHGEKELKSLELPPTLLEYWEDCFYSDYRMNDGKTDYSRITRRLSDQKSLPPLPCDISIVWHEEEDIHDPWLRIELKIHTRFITYEIFNYASRFAHETVKSHLLSEGQIRPNMSSSIISEPHPVCEWLKGGRPPINEDLAIECAILKDQHKLTYTEIGIRNNWPLQRDAYGNLSQCSKARYYVKRGKELLE
jgi:hypothetical protein